MIYLNMTKSRFAWLLIIFSSLLTLGTSEGAIPAPKECEVAEVIRVIDGDTILVRLEGEIHTIRYIGIDAPEMDWLEGNHQYMAVDAYRANKELVKEGFICLEYDIERNDQYGRLLAYVYVNGKQVNEVLLENGWAELMPMPPNQKYAIEFLRMQRQAYNNSLGIWSNLNPPISMAEAINHVGEYRWVQGKFVIGFYIEAVDAVFLQADNGFQVRIYPWTREIFGLFAFDQYLDKEIELAGRIQLSQRRPYMVITDLELIQFFPEQP